MSPVENQYADGRPTLTTWEGQPGKFMKPVTLLMRDFTIAANATTRGTILLLKGGDVRTVEAEESPVLSVGESSCAVYVAGFVWAVFILKCSQR